MLKKRVFVPLGAVAVSVVALLAVVMFARGDGADAPVEDVASQQPEPAAEESVSQSGSAGGYAEGIGVSGAWELTVLNQDGSVAETHEFHNALLGAGRGILAEVLSGDRVISLQGGAGANWDVLLLLAAGSVAGQCPVDESRLADGSCTTDTLNGFHRYEQSTNASLDGQTVVISLETDAFAGPATVERVRTEVRKCAPGDTDGASCSQEFESAFTETEIDPVAIAEGQRILVTVTLSFDTVP